MNVKLKKPKVSLIYAGGTIEAIPSEVGLREDLEGELDVLKQFLKERPDIRKAIHISEPKEALRLLSENMSHGGRDWYKLSQIVAEEINNGASGIVITHGTDTMEFTAAALSFLLQDLAVPVILTGSSFPITDKREQNDALDNLYNSLSFAGIGEVAGVFVVFGGLVLEGTRVIKHVSWDDGRASFLDSGAKPVAFGYGGKFVFPDGSQKWQATTKKNKVEPIGGFVWNEVTFFSVKPDRDPTDLDCLIERPGRRAVILEFYASGTAPARGAGEEFSLVPAVKRARNKGILVFATARGAGRIQFRDYVTAQELIRAGVIPLYDMTTSTAWVKLRWVLSQTQRDEDVVNLMMKNIAGEISEDLILRVSAENITKC